MILIRCESTETVLNGFVCKFLAYSQFNWTGDKLRKYSTFFSHFFPPILCNPTLLKVFFFRKCENVHNFSIFDRQFRIWLRRLDWQFHSILVCSLQHTSIQNGVCTCKMYACANFVSLSFRTFRTKYLMWRFLSNWKWSNLKRQPSILLVFVSFFKINVSVHVVVLVHVVSVFICHDRANNTRK